MSGRYAVLKIRSPVKNHNSINALLKPSDIPMSGGRMMKA